jgi:O-antigen/teichoic acid export membrane protein
MTTSTSRMVFKGGLKLGANQALTQACSFARNVIIARILSPSDYGIAALFAMTFSLLEMLSNLAQERLLIQADEGNEPAFQDTVHLLQAFRGCTNGLAIILLAGPVANLFGVPQAAWAFRYVALLPFIRGFIHTDASRVQRDLKFEPSIAIDAGSTIVVTILAVPLALWFKNYVAMLCVLIAQAALMTVISHFVAERPYRWAYDRTYAKRVFHFGWPLLINGLLMYLIFEGDRFTIGAANRLFHVNAYSLADLGVYSVAFAITMGPAMLVSNISSSLFLPILSRAQNSTHHFERRYFACSQIVALVATMIAVPFMIAGGWVIVLVYGKKYMAAASFIGWLAGMWTLRTVRQSPTLAAMSLGDTKNAMVSNIARALTFIGVLVVAATGHPLSWIAAAGFFGELLALAVCVARLQMVHKVPASLFVRPFGFTIGGMMTAAAISALGVSNFGVIVSVAVSAMLVLVVIGGMFYFFPALRRNVQALVLRSESSVAA